MNLEVRSSVEVSTRRTGASNVAAAPVRGSVLSTESASWLTRPHAVKKTLPRIIHMYLHGPQARNTRGYLRVTQATSRSLESGAKVAKQYLAKSFVVGCLYRASPPSCCSLSRLPSFHYLPALCLVVHIMASPLLTSICCVLSRTLVSSLAVLVPAAGSMLLATSSPRVPLLLDRCSGRLA